MNFEAAKREHSEFIFLHNYCAYITWKSRIAVPKVSSDFAIGENLQLHVARILEDICGYSNCFPGIISQIWDNIRANKSTVFSHRIIFKARLNIDY